jgi:peptidylprolyl isomerase
MYKKISLLVFTIFLIFFLNSCTNKADKEIEERNAYIIENNITTPARTSGLYYIETLTGTGVQAQANDDVVVHYTGYYLNGEIFDSSYQRGRPIEFTLGVGQVIKGWDEGIALMKVGGKAKLLIPSNLAYGSNGYSSIPAYSTLVFDVELIDVY